MKNIFTLILIGMCLLCTQTGMANGLTISNINYDSQTHWITFDVSWQNAWHVNESFHDGIWVFAKYKAANSNQWKHVDITAATLEATGMTFRNDGVGFIMYPSATSDQQFDVATTTVTIKDVEPMTNAGTPELNPSFKVFGVEMVYIPQGKFYAGDTDGNRTFSEPDINEPALINDGTAGVYVRVDENNWTRYTVNPDQYGMGYNAYYMMKYEVTQGLYVEFLNMLNAEQQRAMTLHQTDTQSNYQKYALNPFDDIVTFYLAANNNYNIWDFSYIVGPDELQELPLTYAVDYESSDDPGLAGDGYGKAATLLTPAMLINILDWSGLRPVTELQYEKAARGFDRPVPGEHAWGTTTFTRAINTINRGTEQEVASNTGEGLVNWNISPMRVGFAATDGTDRLESASSYFGVQNLSDNAQEIVLAIQNAADTDFSVLGDGVINVDGTVDADVSEAKVMYRGGGLLEEDQSVSWRENPADLFPITYEPDVLDFLSYKWIRGGGRGVR